MIFFWAAMADWQASAKHAPDANDTHMRTVLAGHAAREGEFDGEFCGDFLGELVGEFWSEF